MEDIREGGKAALLDPEMLLDMLRSARLLDAALLGE